MVITIAITGASGAIYAQRLLERLCANDQVEKVYLIFSTAGRTVYDLERGAFGTTISKITNSDKIEEFKNDDFFAPIASGSAHADAMVIVPCSMGTMARVAAGISSNLIERAADVQLKERAALIVVPRETPLSLIHLNSMTTLTQAGAIVLPACPSFYSGGDPTESVVERVIDQIGVKNDEKYRWGAK